MTETWHTLHYDIYILIWLFRYHKQYRLSSRELLQECAAWIITDTWQTHHFDTYSFSVAFLVSEQYSLGSREHLQECAAWIMTETWHTHHYDTYAFCLALLVSQAILLTESGTLLGVCCLDHERGMGHSPLQYLWFLVWLSWYNKLYW